MQEKDVDPRWIRHLAFTYVNWKGTEHRYVIQPTGAGIGVDDYNMGRPVIHGDVVTRDGDPRPDMGLTRRRTFAITSMTDIEEVQRSI